MEAVFYTGSYALPQQPGICRCGADFEAREFRVCQEWGEMENPSFVLLHPRKNVLYSVSEKTPWGELSAFRTGGDRLVRCSTLPSGGADPCHLALHDSGRWLAVSNYSSGTLAVFELDEEGIPVCMTDLAQHTGVGFRPDRQQSPHIHFAEFRGDHVYVSDLGLDKIACYTLDGGMLCAREADIPLPKGFGPRHLIFHPADNNLLYVLCELASAVVVFRHTERGWKEIQTRSTLPEGYTGESIAAAIRFSEDGKTLFASNRGHDSIAAFPVAEDGRLESLRFCKTGGRTPRDFAVFGTYLLCANQDSSRLTVLRYDPRRGSLEPYPMELTVQQPTCICREK